MSSEARSFNVRASTQQAHRDLDRASPHRPLMNSHAHVILELPALQEVSISGISTCPLPPAARIFHVQPGLGIVSWPPIRRLIHVVPVLFSLHRLAAPLYRYIALALHSSPCPSKFKSRWSLLATVWYLMTPWAPDRGSPVAPIQYTGQHCQCSKLLPLTAIRERERLKIEELNTLPCRVRFVFNLFKF